MGLIRSTLSAATFGAVSPHSRKQRTGLKTLAAAQGKTGAEVAHAGTRREAFGFAPPARHAAARRPGGESRRAAKARAETARRNTGSWAEVHGPPGGQG